MKRLERHKARKRRRTRTILKVFLALILLGGLVAGMMKFDEIKIWASQHYFSLKMGGTTITEEDEPDLYAELSKWHDPSKPLNVLFIGIDKGSVAGEGGHARSDVMM